MTSLQTRSLLIITIIALTLPGSGAIVPACFSRGADSGRIICEDVDLTWVTAQDMTSAFQGTSGVSDIILRRCDVLPDLAFFTSAAASGLKSLTLDGISLRRPLTISPFVQFITSLESMTFSNMLDLETVDFMRIAAIRETWESLHTFTVSNCSLLSLNPELWGFLPRVEKLNIRHNNLSQFEFRTGGFANLVELDASYNGISRLRNLQWNSLPSLERFYIMSNKLFDAEMLNKLPNKVAEIRLDGNLFSDITLNKAARSNLQTLKLSNNSLQTIRPSFYDRRWKLDGNRGLNISGLFSGLTKLKSLSLRFCYITKVEKQFQNLNSLEELDLAENWLEHVPQSTFIGSIKLRRLNLRSNRLSTLDFLQAAGAPDMAVLNSLDLTDNNLNILPSFIKAPNMRLLSIRGNGLDKLSGCDYKEALIKLESFCAPALKPDSPCGYQYFIGTVQRSASRLKVYNDERCCSNPVPTNPACCMQSETTCYSEVINRDLPRSCPTLDILCTAPSHIPTTAVTVEEVRPSQRTPFMNLKGVEWIVAILGYMLALVILGVIIYLLCRKVSADNRRRRLRFRQDIDNEIRLDKSPYHISMKSRPLPIPQKIRAKRLDSGESLGRRKCSDIKTPPIKLNDGYTNQVPKKKVQTAQVQQQETAFCSSSDSTTSISEYNYAVTQGNNSTQHKHTQLSLSVFRSKSATDVGDESSEIPLLPLSSIRPVIGANQQIHHIRDRRQTMTMSPLASHPVRDPGPVSD